jgi:hypothetical protein
MVVRRLSPQKERQLKVDSTMFAREYNIISNRYHNGHNLRESKEKNKILEETENKFHLTQLFDPIACRYKD